MRTARSPWPTRPGRPLDATSSAAGWWPGAAPCRRVGPVAAGPFLLKACARLRNGRGALAQAAAAALPALAALTLAAPHAEAHPQLYAIEGLLLTGQPHRHARRSKPCWPRTAASRACANRWTAAPAAAMCWRRHCVRH